jgi:UDP-N-acetylmuramyl pentapeptide phosphotransferase/UDP-N-acetylglucosamine-1-phosphate transferase
MVILFLVSFVLSLVGAAMLIRNARGHARRYGEEMPQRFHAGDVPRLGGAAIFAASAVGWLAAALQAAYGLPINGEIAFKSVGAWVLMALPAVMGGCFEDYTQRLSVRYRLGLTLLSAILACWLLGLQVPRLGLWGVDTWWAAMPVLGVVLAALAIAGLPHAFNIIDGYNGLAGSVALMVSLALIHVAIQNGDRELAVWLVCLCGGTAGFLVWNYPRGLIFAGDGGAYLWGVVIAVASIQLVQRHAEVSPWFPVLLLLYPVWETMFSIYRKAARGVSPGVADALHIHQLIYRRIVRGVFHDDEARRMLMRNNRTSPYLWGFALLTVMPAVLFWRNTPVLIGFCLLFMVSYVFAYFSIVRFKVQKWTRR